MRAKGLHPGNCLWCLGDQCLAPVWPWGRDPSSPLPVVQHSPCHKSQMGFRESSRMFPYAQYPKWWEKIHTRKKKKWENKTWEIGLNMWGLDTVGWCCHLAVLEHRSQLCPSFPETASCTVLHVPWDLTTCLLISRDIFWGKIIAFTGEISLCSLWIADKLEETPVTGNDVMQFRRR